MFSDLSCDESLPEKEIVNIILNIEKNLIAEELNTKMGCYQKPITGEIIIKTLKCLSESDDDEEESKSLLEELVHQSEHHDVQDFLKTRVDFLQLAKRVMSKNLTETALERMYNVMQILFNLCSNEIIYSMGEDKSFSTAILNLFQCCNVKLLDQLSKITDKIIYCIKEHPQSNWTICLKEFGNNTLSQQLKNSTDLIAVTDKYGFGSETMSVLDKILNSVRTLRNIYKLEISNKDFFLERVLEIDEISPSLQVIFNVMVDCFRSLVKPEHTITSSQYWKFVTHWLAIITNIRQVDSYLKVKIMLDDYGDEKYMELMDILYKILSKFNTLNSMVLEVLHEKFFYSKAEVQAIRKSIELLLTFNSNAVPERLTNILLNLFYDLNQNYEYRSVISPVKTENKYIEDLIRDIKLYWTHTVINISCRDIIRILTMSLYKIRNTALQVALSDSQVPIAKKKQLLTYDFLCTHDRMKNTHLPYGLFLQI